MIKSCNDVTTLNEFEEFIILRLNTVKVGLIETAKILRWDAGRNVNPDRLQTF